MAVPHSSPHVPVELRALRKRRLPLWVILLGGAITILVIAGWWSQRPLARIPLPDGGELVLVAAHYGPTWHRRPQLKEHISLRNRIRRFLSNESPNDDSPNEGSDFNAPEGRSMLWLIFDGFDFNNDDPVSLIRDVTVMHSGVIAGVAEAQELEGDGLGRKRFALWLETYPRRERQLHLQIRMRTQTVEATIPNLFPVTDATPWVPEPLPQSRKLKLGEIVLLSLLRHPTELQLKKTTHLGTSVEPEFVVRETGVRPDAFAFTHEFSDATGNRHYIDLPAGEPAWKIHATVRRNEKYPFPASEGTSVGHVSMPGPGEVRVFPVPANIAAGPGHYAVFTGPGEYRVFFGKELTIESIQPSSEQGTIRQGASGQTFTCDKPQFWFFGPSTMTPSSYEDGPTGIARAVTRTGHVVFQQRVPLPGNPSPKAGNEDYERVEKTLRAGDDLDIRFILAELEFVDFLARPPPQ